MKKIIIFVSLMTVAACGLVGCGKDKSKGQESKDVSVQQDIVEFVNEEVPAIRTYRDSAIATYNSYFEESNMDTDTFLQELTTSAMPDMQTFIDKLEDVDIDTAEVEELRGLYVSSAQKQYDAMELVTKAIQEENPDYLTQADLLIAEAENLLSQYESQLKLLCIDYDVEINGSFE